MTHPRKLMTVLLLSAGCGTTAAPRSAPATASGAADRPTPRLAGTAQHAALAVMPAAAPVAPPPIAPDDAQPPARLALRGELYNVDAATARREVARFRALCDADGYPLVGNLANKGIRYEVAAYCADVRTAAAAPAVRGPSGS